MNKEFIKAVAKIQKELKAPKNQFNKFGNYNYRNTEDILEAVKPMLGDLILTLDDDIVMVGDRIYVKSVATITDGIDSISKTAFAREPEEAKGMSSSQLTGATSAYSSKYALGKLLLLDDSKDADSTNQHGKEDKPSGFSKKAPEKKEEETTQSTNEEPTKSRVSFRRK